MRETFTFRESYELLQINPKSFQEWLKRAGIDPNAQVDKFDPRKKYLTREQLVMLAEAHGRMLPPLDNEEQRPEAAVSNEALAEQLAVLQQWHLQRFEQIDYVLTQLVAHVQGMAAQQHDLQQTLTQALSAIEELRSATQTEHGNGMVKASVQQEVVGAATVTPSPASSSSASATRRQTKRSTAKSASKKKKMGRGRKLPAGLVLLRDFAGQHHVVTERASAAGRSGKIKITQGKWLVNSRWATEALDEEGQHDFYEVFHKRAGFAACEQCPHPLSQQIS